jgi:hypothetical protein
MAKSKGKKQTESQYIRNEILAAWTHAELLTQLLDKKYGASKRKELARRLTVLIALVSRPILPVADPAQDHKSMNSGDPHNHTWQQGTHMDSLANDQPHIDMSDIFSIGKRKTIPIAQREVYPNLLFLVDDHHGALVVLNSTSGPDFPIGQRGLDKMLLGLKNKKIETAWVVLFRRKSNNGSLEYVAQYDATKVLKICNEQTAQVYKPELGPCWFVNSEFVLCGPIHTSRDDF